MTQQSKYPWTDGGRELLSEVENSIANYGGNEKVLTAIECEWMKLPKRSKRQNWRSNQEAYLKQWYLHKPYKELGILMGKTEKTVRDKIHRMYKKGWKRKV